MRKQQQIWQAEHTNPEVLPSLATSEPGSTVVEFVTYLKDQRLPLKGRAIDIGCGKGRNSVYLASVGCEVYAVDYIQLALDAAEKLAAEKGVAEQIHFIRAALDQTWPFDDTFFDFAVDCFSSIDIETKEGRAIYRDEMFRTLRPGGLAVVSVCSADDEWEREAIAARPGPEPNSAYWENGKFKKNYTENELREFYQQFEIVSLTKVSKPAIKLGRKGIATNFHLILRKPTS